MKIKEPYLTGIIIGLTTFSILGVAYIAMPEKYRVKMLDFIKKKFKKKDENKGKDKSTS